MIQPMPTTEFDRKITDAISSLRGALQSLEDQQGMLDDLGVAASAETITKLANEIMVNAMGNEFAIGRSWAQVGMHFGISEQVARERFGKVYE